MLFNFPTFISTKEQDPSERLYNNVKILIQTQIQEIWVDLDFGSEIRNKLKQGINNIILVEIKNELEIKINQYFSNDLLITKLDVKQDVDKIRVDLEYKELRTGIFKSVQSDEVIVNNSNTSFY